MIRKKEDMNDESFDTKIPLNSGLLKRVKRVSELTGLSYPELLQRWLSQEENTISASRCYAETIRAQLKQGLAEQLRDLFHELHEEVIGKIKNEDKGKEGKEIKEVKEVKEIKEDKEGKEGKEDKKSDKLAEYRVMLVKKIQGMRDRGISFGGIAKQFNEEGVATLSGIGKWYPSSVFQFFAKNH